MTAALSLDVERKLYAVWPSQAEQATASALLQGYGSSGGQLEPDRVRLALIKLSQGSLEELQALIERATLDYRDVLLWAEYPEESKASHLVRADLGEAERKELRAIRTRDRQQYEAWLRG